MLVDGLIEELEIYARIAQPGARGRQALTFGLVAWLMAQVPRWLLWHVEQPWPGEVVLKQLALELVSVFIVSLVVAAMHSSIPAGQDEPIAAVAGGVVK